MRAILASFLLLTISLPTFSASAQSLDGRAEAWSELLNSFNPQQAAVMSEFSGISMESRKKCNPDTSGGGCDIKREGQYCPSFEQKTGKCVMRDDESCYCDPKALNDSALTGSQVNF